MQHSLFQEAMVEATRHKYLESEKAGHDLGLSAIVDWHERHWTIWLRHRWLEHLLGVACWEEFEPERFGRLAILFGAHRDLLDPVADMVRAGAENLDIVWWAARHRRDLGTLTRMLVELRLNDTRCTRNCINFAKILRP
jgi:hypothetical protein